MRFVCALEGPPFLARVEGDGTTRPLPRRAVLGTPTYVATSSAGRTAYTTVLSGQQGGPWPSAMVILDAADAVVDIVANALPTVPPSWSADGERLVFVRAHPQTARRDVVVYDPQHGEHPWPVGGHVQSVTWMGATGLLVSTGATLVAWDPDGSAAREVFSSPTGAAFQRYGTDDLYLTLETPAVSRFGVIAVTRRWHEQGKPASDGVCLIVDDQLEEVAVQPSRGPQWRGDQLLVTGTDAVHVLAGAREVLESVQVPGVHAADWARGRSGPPEPARLEATPA